ncbi:ASCH domain-containing protein [Salinicoccus halitifaciens]|uniref:Uncharacterized protein YhfF n=1 Tax=Salinicoccus halitifaciens TaxID=1073415 RepID=A0ABV2EAE6_9STAP|nr:ASCH domain-containing protein [Salinicoccus halitifaciens]MCD2138405.1 ASCH domain-containing protein [Salinicoccus halitifaciens]
MKVEELWREFTAKHPEYKDEEYMAWPYGSVPNELAELTQKGIKTATASAYELYELENEPVPEPEDFSIILDSTGEAVCIIRTTRIDVVPFDEVTADFAWKEGEGDRSLQYWRKVHTEFFEEEYARHGMSFNEKIKVVCEEFERVY